MKAFVCKKHCSWSEFAAKPGDEFTDADLKGAGVPTDVVAVFVGNGAFEKLKHAAMAEAEATPVAVAEAKPVKAKS